MLQTVFLRLVRRGQDHAAPPAVAHAASYLCRAAINAALDLLRQQRQARSLPLDEAHTLLERPAATGAEREHAATELRAWLRGALCRLHPRSAELFALRYLEGYENREIARMLGTSRVTVAVSLHRTRLRLRRQLLSREKGRP